MDNQKAEKILNHYIFDGEKRNIIEKLATNPGRYTGIFRPTKPKAKLIQNILTSHEIRFGDALEALIRELIAELGFQNLPRKLRNDDIRILSVDQLFTNGEYYYLVEQKIRDDHDSSKKRGQVDNFEAKLKFLYPIYQSNLIGIMYFIDPTLNKNKNYYYKEIERLKKLYNADLHLFYGKEFFYYLGYPNFWKALISWIDQWKNGLSDIPEINFDLFPNKSFEEIKNIEPIYWKKLIGTESIWEDGIIRVLFGNGTTLNMLFSYFSQQTTSEYANIAKSLLERINKYYY
jgi:hypothetical protein